MNIAIAGTRGIPNHYGGFEQVAQYLSAGLVQKGHSVTVYNAHHHPYKEQQWKGVQIIHCYDAEHFIGTAGQFIYDLNCIRDAGKRHFDVVLFLGYTSSSVWGRWFPREAVIISNMDGMEWKRSKYAGPVKRFLRYAEKLAVKYSHHLIADSPAVKSYLDNKYRLQSSYIPYGANIPADTSEAVLKPFSLSSRQYYMLMARMEPENNIDMILQGFSESKVPEKFVVVGNTNNAFGKKMLEKYRHDERILFTGAIFDEPVINALRKFSKLYFHGHSVGGTNPSLLEAMAAGAPIAAHDNEFNRAVLQQDALYFNDAGEVHHLVTAGYGEKPEQAIEANLGKIRTNYNWPAVVDAYETVMLDCYHTHKR